MPRIQTPSRAGICELSVSSGFAVYKAAPPKQPLPSRLTGMMTDLTQCFLFGRRWTKQREQSDFRSGKPGLAHFTVRRPVHDSRATRRGPAVNEGLRDQVLRGSPARGYHRVRRRSRHRASISPIRPDGSEAGLRQSAILGCVAVTMQSPSRFRCASLRQPRSFISTNSPAFSFASSLARTARPAVPPRQTIVEMRSASITAE